MALLKRISSGIILEQHAVEILQRMGMPAMVSLYFQQLCNKCSVIPVTVNTTTDVWRVIRVKINNANFSLPLLSNCNSCRTIS